MVRRRLRSLLLSIDEEEPIYSIEETFLERKQEINTLFYIFFRFSWDSSNKSRSIYIAGRVFNLRKWKAGKNQPCLTDQPHSLTYASRTELNDGSDILTSLHGEREVSDPGVGDSINRNSLWNA
ncbi:Uncharacterized protein Fot_21562 [Forsythia ovata]|uniref:Uncharacterized protein n=1 Tax=Forsythia ovata TaxID=205694 RepID=A0ABD1T7B3_9LAMI